MHTKKIILALLTVFFMISCQKDDGQLQEIEKLETSKALLAVDICEYKPIKMIFHAGSLRKCELLEKMNDRISDLSSITDEKTGCPRYKIQYYRYNCQVMDDKTYVQEWQVLDDCNCADEVTLDVDLDGDFQNFNTLGRRLQTLKNMN